MKAQKGNKRKQTVITDWRYTKEATPAFRKLMRALLDTNLESNNRKGEANENGSTIPK